MKENNVKVVRIPTVEERKAATEKPATEATAPTLDEMQKKIALQQQQLDKLNQLFNDRTRFSQTREDLKRFKSSIDSAIKSGLIESPAHRLIFAEKGNYRDEPLISVSSPLIMQEFLEFIDEKIKNKLQQLDANIVSMAA